MIDLISSWTEQIVLAVVIATILEMLLPNGKNKKYVRMVIGIYVLFCIISPFVNLDTSFSFTDLDIEDYVSMDIKTDEVDQTSMDARLEELYIQELEKEITKTVQDQGFDVKKCKVDAKLLDEENAGIKKIELAITVNKTGVSQVENVEISVSKDSKDLSSTQKNEDSNNLKSEETSVNANNAVENDDTSIKKLKENLASYYEISQDIISIVN